ncbi:hypothetical protein ACHAWO_012975 [Cyclotella atomus]|uniref:Uncharacterized protein n=1 Tax=Cyclotella atomus TaxID=382360 RepID=A0ABD3PVK7_9STRA
MSSAKIDDAANDTCCLPFDPSLWQDDEGNDYKVLHWDEKPFVKDGTYCCLHVPLNFGKAVTRSMNKIDNVPEAKVPKDQFMILSECTSPWYSNVYVSVATAKVEGATVETISGDFLAKAFEGDYSNIRKWVKEMKTLLPKVRESMDGEKDSAAKSSANKFYFYYPTCPKCAKKYGKNHVVILASL